LPLLFNSALEYVVRRVHVNQDGLKLNGTHRLLVSVDDVKISSLGVELFHADRQTNGETDMPKPIVTFRIYANAPETIQLELNMHLGCLFSE